MTHHAQFRVYYEDTDLAGIVYYANYLKFIERARTEWARDLGIDQNRLRDDHGLVFAVRRVEADFLRPAKFDDVLTIMTSLVELGGARVVLDQSVLRGTEQLFAASVTLVMLSGDGRPARIPEHLRANLSGNGDPSPPAH